jgi:hypothetical protein
VNKEWSELNKAMQTKIRKSDTYEAGIDTLFELRNRLMKILTVFYSELNREEFNAIPFLNADGYHSKTIAYSIWHIFRIEDIVAHILINEDEQVFYTGNYQERINSPIITTGKELYSYIFEVKVSTEKIIKSLSYVELKKKVSEERKEYLKSLNVVSNNENAIWLIDYWCNKDIRELIQMPFSRHWIMHIEACLRIRNKIHL